MIARLVILVTAVLLFLSAMRLENEFLRVADYTLAVIMFVSFIQSVINNRG